MSPAAVRVESLRFPLRTAGFVGLTFGMYGLLEADTAGRARMRRCGVHSLHDLLDEYRIATAVRHQLQR